MTSRSRAWMVGALALLAAQPAAAQELPAGAKNYLIIIMDDLGIDKVSSYAADYAGYAPSYLPNTQTVDSIAAAGLRFTRAWATPLCSPTRVSFQTGQQPFRTGVGTALGSSAAGVDPASFLMLAESFAGRGYNTGMFGKWHLGTRNAAGVTGVPATATFTTEPHPSLAGWERFFGGYDGYPGPSAADPDDGYFKWVRVSWLKGGSGTVATETDHATLRTEAVASSWINSRTQPWLAVVAFNAAHSGTTASSVWGYQDVDPPTGSTAAPIQYRTAALSCLTARTCASPTRQVYQGLVEDMDIKIQTLLDSIDDDELDNTLIIVFGDNGTPGENNGTATAVQESIFNVVGRGKSTTYENGVRVPLIVADGAVWRRGGVGPTITSPGRTVAARFNTLDIYNTLHNDAFMLSVAGVDSMPFTQCFTNTDVYCGFTAKRYGYTETFTSNTTPVGAKVAVSYGEDTMVATYDNAVGRKCMAATFYDTSTDSLETTPLTWTGIRAQRLRDYFTNLHTPVTDWAHLAGNPVVTFCP